MGTGIRNSVESKQDRNLRGIVVQGIVGHLSVQLTRSYVPRTSANSMSPLSAERIGRIIYGATHKFYKGITN